MPQLVSSDGEIFELSELAAQQSVTLVNIRADTGDDAPIPVPLLLAERVAQLLQGKSADALRALLRAPDDLSDDEKARRPR